MKKSISLLSIGLFLVFITACKKDIDNNDEDIKSSVPLIQNTSGGALSDGSVIEISGVSFGNNDSSSEFLKDNIESGTSGTNFEKTGWSQYYSTKALYSNNDAHSGNNSIVFTFGEDNSGCGVIYDNGSDFQEAYLSAWIKLVKNDNQTRFQWKNWRIKNTKDYHVGIEGHSGVIGDCWWGANSGIWGNSDVQVFSDGTAIQSEKRSLEPDAFLFDTWQRIEAYYKKSNTDVDDGLFEWRRIGRSEDEVIISNYDAVTHENNSSDQLWRYIMIGHYYGNLSGGEGRDMKIYYDDIYIGNSRARVELGDNKSWDDCILREIQVPTTWAENSITIEVNQGSFQSGDTAYLFVVDETGNVSEGFQVIIN